MFMYKIEFDPANSFASSVLSQTWTCRNIIEQAFTQSHRSKWGDHVFTIRPIDPSMATIAKETFGGLRKTVEASLRASIPASFHVKRGRVVLRIETDDEDSVARLSDQLHQILLNSSLGKGIWTFTRSLLPISSITACDESNQFFIPRLELPMPQGCDPYDTHAVEGALADAILAARINIAAASNEPELAIKSLPTQPIHVEATNFEMVGKKLTGSDVDFCTFLNVRFWANIRISGEPMIGRSNSFGNGLIFQTNQL